MYQLGLNLESHNYDELCTRVIGNIYFLQNNSSNGSFFIRIFSSVASILGNVVCSASPAYSTEITKL